MKQSQLFTKTSKTVSADEVSVNARFLEQAGFIYKNSAGIYSYLPLGWRVLQKIAQIIREEMNAVDGQEVFMPALHDKHYLKATGRWDVDVVFKVVEGDNKEPNFNISWTHEEIITEIASRYVSSYKDLPFAAYQIQTKFRNEPRAKSGILRGREFMMKDLYSFHHSEADMWEYYNRVAKAYQNVFNRIGLKAIYTLAAGGDFTVNNTHEFQVVCDVGEDTIFVCQNCGYAENDEVATLNEGGECTKCKGIVSKHTSVEVGNIFPLGTKYSQAFNFQFTNDAGSKELVVMASYGIGLGRCMGTLVEVSHDDKGIIWPKSVAPFGVHLVPLFGKSPEVVQKHADEIYAKLEGAGIEVLYDDRDMSAGEKFADSDLIGIPVRLIVSEKLIEKNEFEIKLRSGSENAVYPTDKLVEIVQAL